MRFISAYAASEAERGSLGVRFVSVLPQLTPATDLGARLRQAYADYEGRTVDDSAVGALTLEKVGQGLLELATDDENSAPAYLLTRRRPQPCRIAGRRPPMASPTQFEGSWGGTPPSGSTFPGVPLGVVRLRGPDPPTSTYFRATSTTFTITNKKATTR